MARKPKAAKGKPAKANGQKMFQITPIIIKGGGSIDFTSDFLDFEDDSGRKGPHFKIKEKGRISELTIKGDVKVEPQVAGKPLYITIKGDKVNIGVSFLME